MSNKRKVKSAKLFVTPQAMDSLGQTFSIALLAARFTYDHPNEYLDFLISRQAIPEGTKVTPESIDKIKSDLAQALQVLKTLIETMP